MLNDDWASHPTWASEDSGFVAHRKNIYEESLHRIEEERHDYDFNIETNAKVIQLLEPIAQSLLAMTSQERQAFRLPIGLGTPSRAVYCRVMKKIYSGEGPRVVQELFEDPCAVLPVIMPRLKQKDEEWRTSQVSYLQQRLCSLTDFSCSVSGRRSGKPRQTQTTYVVLTIKAFMSRDWIRRPTPRKPFLTRSSQSTKSNVDNNYTPRSQSTNLPITLMIKTSSPMFSRSWFFTSAMLLSITLLNVAVLRSSLKSLSQTSLASQQRLLQSAWPMWNVLILMTSKSLSSTQRFQYAKNSIGMKMLHRS